MSKRYIQRVAFKLLEYYVRFSIWFINTPVGRWILEEYL